MAQSFRGCGHQDNGRKTKVCNILHCASRSCFINTRNSRLLKDAQLFDSKLSKIAGFNDMGKTLIEAVNAKTVTEEKPVAAAPSLPETDKKEDKQEIQEGPKQEREKEKPLPDAPKDEKADAEQQQEQKGKEDVKS